MVQPNRDPLSQDLTVRKVGGTYWIEVFSGPFKGDRLKSYGSAQIAGAVTDLRREGYNVRLSSEMETALGGLPSRTTSTFPDYGLMEGAGAVAAPSTPQPGTSEAGGFREPKLSDSTYDLIDENTGKVIGRNVALFNSHYQEYLDYTAGIGGVGGVGGTGRTGPTAAELAIERSKVDAQNLATFISGTIAELELEIDAKRLTTEQATGEFNKRLDAFAEAGSQFQGIQPYTIPIGAEYVPGRQPGGIGEQLGIEPRKAEVIQFDPFAMASEIVAESPNLMDIGVPDTGALAEANRIARQFLGV